MSNDHTVPLLKHTWGGRFSYNLKDDGHEWRFENPKAWKVSTKHPPNKSQPKREHRLPTALRKRAELVWNSITKFPNPFADANDYPLIKWLAGKGEGKPDAGLSTLLNAVVLNATFKPFEIVSSFVGPHVTVNIRGLRQYEPSWFYLGDLDLPKRTEQNVLVDPESFGLSLVDNELICNEDMFTQRANEFEFVRALARYRLVSLSIVEMKGKSKFVIGVECNVEMVRYEKAQYCRCIPVPGKFTTHGASEPHEVRTPEVIVTPVVGPTLEQLSQIWQDRNRKKSVLISAPPGSGKEVFCNSIAPGNGRDPEKIQAISMATDDQASLERLLLGTIGQGATRLGAIERAAGSALFLDEVHQPESTNGTKHRSPARAALLRPLEAGEYVPVGGSVPEQVRDVLFILATSKSLDKLPDYEPKDFWTRMTHVVSMSHPLDQLEESDAEEMLACFFRFFWWERAEDYARSVGGDGSTMHDAGTALLACQSKVLLAVARSDTTNGEKDAGVRFAKNFLTALNDCGGSLKLFSIRGIRSVVLRLFYQAITRIAQGRPVIGDQFNADVIRSTSEVATVASLAERANTDEVTSQQPPSDPKNPS